jgi:phosphate/sulfate permease
MAAAFIGIAMLIWDCVEVGRNDAANLVNAVFGARVLARRTAVILAGIAVIMGASAASPVMETARRGIFDPTVLTFQMAMTIYISVYFIDTVLLYGFSGFGMPVSTTACLVFELVGAALFLAGFDNVNWPNVGKVVTGIVASIAISGIASFFLMRVFRGAIKEKTQDRQMIMMHGPWVAGAMFSWLIWFMVFKGLKSVPVIKSIKADIFETYSLPLVLLLLWASISFMIYLALVFFNNFLTKYLFHITAVVGMICMAFAFGQNDLANCASPGLAAFTLWQNSDTTTAMATEINISLWILAGCGVLMASGMFTQYAQRVTRAEVNTGSQHDHVALYAPNWCKRIARIFVKARGPEESLAPEPSLNERGKKMHYDALRASAITAVSASVIAFASGNGIPVSTTYVAFAAVIGTGMGDRVFVRGDSDVKLGRAIWVVSCWFIAPVIAIVSTGIMATIVYNLSTAGLAAGLGLNFAVRYFLKKSADSHENKHHLGQSDDDSETPGSPNDPMPTPA